MITETEIPADLKPLLFDGRLFHGKWGELYFASKNRMTYSDLSDASLVRAVHDHIYGRYFLHDITPHWQRDSIMRNLYRYAKPWVTDLSGLDSQQLIAELLDLFQQDELRVWQLSDGWAKPAETTAAGPYIAAGSTPGAGGGIAPSPIVKKSKSGGRVSSNKAVSSTAAHESQSNNAAAGTLSNQVTERFGDNEAVWVIDEQGRPVSVTATLSSSYSEARTSQEKQHQRKVGGEARLETDDGGHIIGHRFMSDQGLKNLFPQDANLNRGAYKSMENEWEDWTKEGYEVKLTVRLDPPGSDRPDNIIAEYQVFEKTSGDMVFERDHRFDNQRGEKFVRVKRENMQDFRS